MFLEENIQYRHDDDDLSKQTYTIFMIVENDYFSKLFSKHKYSKDELTYTIEKIIEGRIVNCIGTKNECCLITDISFRGIQLLEMIRPESIWEKTKNIASKAGNHTLSFIEDTAQKIAVAASAALIGNLYK